MVGVLAVILIVCRCRCLSSYTEFQAVMGCICRVGERLIEGCHASCPESTQRERSGGVCVYWQRHCHADQCRGRLNKEMCVGFRVFKLGVDYARARPLLALCCRRSDYAKMAGRARVSECVGELV